jgi:protein with PEP-CTERM/exosortase system signal
MSLDARRFRSRQERSFVKKSDRGSSDFLTNVCYSLQLSVCHSLQAAILQVDVRSSKLACLLLFFKDMKSSFTLLLVLTAATIFSLAQPVKAGHVVQGGPTYVTVPDGGSTMSLLGFALLGVAALRRKLGR